MQFGVLYDFRNPAAWRRPWAQTYRALLDQIASLEDLGFDAVWLTEHHFVEDGYLPAVFPVAGAVAARTSRLQIGTNVLLLPLNHPVLVAENAAVLDVLSEGRFVLGVGLGYRDEEFRGLGIRRGERAGRMEEGLSVLRQCWADGPFDHAGRYWQLAGVDVQPKPVQSGGVPIWVGAHGDRALERAARLGDGWLAAGAGRAEYMAYRAACERHGRPVGPIAALRNVWVGDWSQAQVHAAYVRDTYRRWYAAAADRPVDTSDESFSITWQLVGDGESVIDQIHAYHDELPFEQLIMLVHLAGMHPEASLESLTLFSRKVLPRFK